MIEQIFSIGRGDWLIEVYYDVKPRNLQEIYDILTSSGCSNRGSIEACNELYYYNSGYTFSNFRRHLTIIIVSRATDGEQMYDSIQHETRHAADHIGEYYGIDPRGEESAYLQGEISRKMFSASSKIICNYGT